MDEDPTTNFANKLLLEEMGVTEKVLRALKGREGLEVIKGKYGEGDCPQLILLDINMPLDLIRST